MNDYRKVLDISDIPGTSPNIFNKNKKSYIDQPSVVKESMDVSDINGRQRDNRMPRRNLAVNRVSIYEIP
jgi:hypothetical protein